MCQHQPDRVVNNLFLETPDYAFCPSNHTKWVVLVVCLCNLVFYNDVLAILDPHRCYCVLTSFLKSSKGGGGVARSNDLIFNEEHEQQGAQTQIASELQLLACVYKPLAHGISIAIPHKEA